MLNDKERKSGYLPLKLSAIPAFTKIVNLMEIVYSKIAGVKKNNAQNVAAQQLKQAESYRQNAIANLQSEGKDYETAASIVDTLDKWDLDPAKLDPSKIELKKKISLDQPGRLKV